MEGQELPKTLKEQLQETVKRSGGKMIFLPDKLVPEAKQLTQYAEKVDSMVVQLNEQEIKLSVKSQNFWLKVREYLKENGYPENWAKEVGWNQQGAKEGIFVVNIIDKQ